MTQPEEIQHTLQGAKNSKHSAAFENNRKRDFLFRTNISALMSSYYSNTKAIAVNIY